jgi:RND superfamily putative drug exporter
MIGVGLAIDYGLFVVSRFREEIADGYDTETAVRRSVMTAGRTVTFSAVIVIASAAGLLLFPQGFLKSLTYAVIAAVMLSAVLSVTLLPACLGVLGRHVDAFGVRTLLRIPFFRNWKPTNWWLNWLAHRLQKTKTREEIETGFWGQLLNRVMKRPILFAAPIIVVLILLIIPLGKLSLGGISEKYLPPNNPVRQAQEDFDRTFPGFRAQQLTLVIQNASPPQIDAIANKAAQVSGFTNPTWQPRPATDEGNPDPKVTVLQNGLVNSKDAAAKISYLRSIQPARGVTLWVGGTPALEQDSIRKIITHMPLMVVILICTTTILMFLTFGSLVLPIKAAVMTALTMGSTLGVLTWVFVDGHFSKWLNFTPTPLTAPVIGLIIAMIYGLSTDYEVFLLSRMVEARERGMSTAEATRLGTAASGRVITAAALIPVVVGASFAFSDLVMMKYLAFGLVSALLLDATVVRMFLVPSVMKLLGEDCWWAPLWMRRIQNRIGLGEIDLPDERRWRSIRQLEEALVGVGGPADARPAAHSWVTQQSTDGLSMAAKSIGNNAAAVAHRTYRAAQSPTREEGVIEASLVPRPGARPQHTAGEGPPQGVPTAVHSEPRPSADTAAAIELPRHPGHERADRGMGAGVSGADTEKPWPAWQNERQRRNGGISVEELLRREQDERQRRNGGISVEELLRREQDERQRRNGSVSVEEVLRRWQDERQRRNGSESVEELLRCWQDERQRRNGSVSVEEVLRR